MPVMRKGFPAPAGVLLLLLVACTSGCASRLLLVPEGSHRYAGRRPEKGVEPVVVENDDGFELGGLLVAVPGDHGTVMVSGGNAMGRHQTYHYTKFLHGHGFRVLVFSFQGYDDNGGGASLSTLLRDATLFHDELRRRFPGEPVVYLASSISTAPALCLPSRRPDLAGVILEGTINIKTIPFAKVRDWWPLWPLAPLTLPFAAGVSLAVPGELSAGSCASEAGNVPALFLHHPRDVMTTYAGARDIYEEYGGPKHFEILDSRNAQYHLLLGRDLRAQDVVLHAIGDWLGPKD